MRVFEWFKGQLPISEKGKSEMVRTRPCEGRTGQMRTGQLRNVKSSQDMSSQDRSSQVRTYFYTCILTCSYNCILVWWHAHLVASLPICILGNLHTFNIQCFYSCILTYFHTCILVYNPTCIFAYLYNCILMSLHI